MAYSGHDTDTERIKAKSSSITVWRHPVLKPKLSHKNHFACLRLASKGYSAPKWASTQTACQLFIQFDYLYTVQVYS